MFIDETRDWAGGESGPSRKSTQIRTGFWGILGVDSLSVEVGRRSTCVIGVSAIDGARAPTCRLCCTGVWNLPEIGFERITYLGNSNHPDSRMCSMEVREGWNSSYVGPAAS